jgi:hypothetical protein
LTTITFVAFVALAAAVPSAHAEESRKAERNVAGTWTMTVEAPPPHGPMSMRLALRQDGRRVTGTCSPPHGAAIPLEGELIDDRLTLASPSGDDGEPQLSLTATLKDDGTLSGYLSNARGDMTWTATRVRDTR